MKMFHLATCCSLLLAAFCGAPASAQDASAWNGQWELLPRQSTDVDHFWTLGLEVDLRGNELMIVHSWKSRVTIRDTVRATLGGPPVDHAVRDWVFPSNVFMGLMMPVGDHRRIAAKWKTPGKVLVVEERCAIRSSQGSTPVTTIRTYELTDEKDILVIRVQRSSRRPTPVMNYVMKRKGAREAFAYRLDGNWEIGGKLPVNAMMISLQGLANKNGPLVYLLYPDDWPFTYVNAVYDFYRERRYYSFKELKTADEAVQSLARYAQGYVVWDTAVRTSLIVAFTVAGLENAVVVTEAQIPLMEKAGLRRVEDFRGKFTGMTDAGIYAWAADRYWKRCNKECLIWLGGEHGRILKPGVADWGILKQVFFNDLSSRPADSAEYVLAKRLLGEMKPMSMVMGWHSYAKDLEEEHVTLTSSFGHRVEGLNTVPNLSFSAQIPVSPGFTFKNNHHLTPGARPIPGKKVYISCVQTDGMGLGSWLKPGRGEIPYAWEVTMNYTWMAPGMAEFFYATATTNDYLIGCLSGPGYMYPKAVPPKLLPQLIALAREQMKALDLRVFETMDWSEGSEVEGNTDLTGEIIDAYYSGMPEAIGFVNGYGPGYTFAVRDGRPMVSYDYYLSPTRPEADAVTDLQELAALNPRRPYFLLMHVRETSDVKRVKGILDQLGPEFEVVPLDIFLAMAGTQPTFKERWLGK